MASAWSFNRAALGRLVNDSPESRAVLTKVATGIRDDARANARSISPRLADAIQYEVGSDDEGVYADVGYSKYHPGFVLWWHEVGTVNHPARPHLRPAVKPGRI